MADEVLNEYRGGTPILPNQQRIDAIGRQLDVSTTYPTSLPNDIIPYANFYVMVFKNETENIEEDFRVNFQFLPQQFIESKSANFEDIVITGYSIPLKTYGGSSSNSISVVFEFFALEPDNNESAVLDIIDENAVQNYLVNDTPIEQSLSSSDTTSMRYSVVTIFNTVKKLKSLTYSGPYQEESNYFTYPPKICWLRLGSQLGMWCVCRSVQITYKTDPTPWDLDRVLPFGVSVQCVFEEIEHNIQIPTNYRTILMQSPGPMAGNPDYKVSPIPVSSSSNNLLF